MVESLFTLNSCWKWLALDRIDSLGMDSSNSGFRTDELELEGFQQDSEIMST